MWPKSYSLPTPIQRSLCRLWADSACLMEMNLLCLNTAGPPSSVLVPLLFFTLQTQGSTYHLSTDNFQIYILTQPSQLNSKRTHQPTCLFERLTRHYQLDMFKAELLTPLSKHAPLTLFCLIQAQTLNSPSTPFFFLYPTSNPSGNTFVSYITNLSNLQTKLITSHYLSLGLLEYLSH